MHALYFSWIPHHIHEWVKYKTRNVPEKKTWGRAFLPIPGSSCTKKILTGENGRKKKINQSVISPLAIFAVSSHLIRDYCVVVKKSIYLYYNILLSFYTIKTSNEPERSPIILYLVRSITLIQTDNITGRGRPNYKYIVSTVVGVGIRIIIQFPKIRPF